MEELTKLADIRTGFAFRSRLEHQATGPVAIIQMRDLDDSGAIDLRQAVRVEASAALRAQLLQPGDLLFRSRGNTFRAAQVPEGLMPAVLAAPMLRIRPLNIESSYLLWFINSDATQAALNALAEGTAVQMISKQHLGRLAVPVPTIERQARIAECAALATREQVLMEEVRIMRHTLVGSTLARAAKDIR